MINCRSLLVPRRVRGNWRLLVWWVASREAQTTHSRHGKVVKRNRSARHPSLPERFGNCWELSRNVCGVWACLSLAWRCDCSVFVLFVWLGCGLRGVRSDPGGSSGTLFATPSFSSQPCWTWLVRVTDMKDHYSSCHVVLLRGRHCVVVVCVRWDRVSVQVCGAGAYVEAGGAGVSVCVVCLWCVSACVCVSRAVSVSVSLVCCDCEVCMILIYSTKEQMSHVEEEATKFGRFPLSIRITTCSITFDVKCSFSFGCPALLSRHACFFRGFANTTKTRSEGPLRTHAMLAPMLAQQTSQQNLCWAVDFGTTTNESPPCGKRRNIEPDKFTDRIIFMLTFNDFDWTRKGKFRIQKKVKTYAKKFLQGHWTFLGPGDDKKWYGKAKYFPEGKWDWVASQMVQRFQETGHPIFQEPAHWVVEFWECWQEKKPYTSMRMLQTQNSCSESFILRISSVFTEQFRIGVSNSVWQKTKRDKKELSKK